MPAQREGIASKPALPQSQTRRSQLGHVTAGMTPMIRVGDHQLDVPPFNGVIADSVAYEKLPSVIASEGDHIPIAIGTGIASQPTAGKPNLRVLPHDLIHKRQDGLPHSVVRQPSVTQRAVPVQFEARLQGAR